MRQYFTLPIAALICCFPSAIANALTNTGLTPREAGCINIGGSAQTFSQSYSYGSVTRRIKAGIQHSQCGFWGVYEGSVDSLLSIETEDGNVLAKGMMEKPGVKFTSVGRGYSGGLKACIIPPFSTKMCSGTVYVNS